MASLGNWNVRIATLSIAMALTACEAPVTPPEDRLPSIVMDRVELADAQANLEFIGEVAMQQETTLAFTSGGIIVSLDVDTGDAVRKGQLLAALDSTTVQAELVSATAEADRTDLEYERLKQLFDQGWVTRTQIEAAEAARRVAKARVESAQFQVNNAAIRAPASGLVLSRSAEPGQTIEAGVPVLVIGEAPEGFILQAAIPDRELVGLSLGTPAVVQLDPFADREFGGRIIRIAGEADPTTGTYAVDVSLPNDALLRPGQIGRVRFAVDRETETVVAPSSAVFAARAGEGFVYVFDPDSRRVSLRKIAIGKAIDRGILVTAGLEPGELVAISRADQLADGMEVAPAGSINETD